MGRLKLPPINPETTILPPRATAATAKAIDFSLPAKSTISSKPPSVSLPMRLATSASAGSEAAAAAVFNRASRAAGLQSATRIFCLCLRERKPHHADAAKADQQ